MKENPEHEAQEPRGGRDTQSCGVWGGGGGAGSDSEEAREAGAGVLEQRTFRKW